MDNGVDGLRKLSDRHPTPIMHSPIPSWHTCFTAQISGNAAQAQLQANLTATIVNMIQYWRGVDQTVFTNAQILGMCEAQ